MADSITKREVFIMRRLGLSVLSVGLGLLLPASNALGQGSGLINHQKCYKIKDTSVRLKALADLYTPQFGPDSDCQVRKAKLFCVPANKQVTEATDRKTSIQVQRLGEELTDNDSICYKIKCRKPFPADRMVTDQFGTHELTKLKPSLLCVPAVKSCLDTTLTFAGSRANGQGACRQFDGNQTACNGAWMAQSGEIAMSCTFNTTLNECHGCGDGGNGQPGCSNTCHTCADAGRTQLTDGDRCRDVVAQGPCEAAWHVGGFAAESCFWDTSVPLSPTCRGCGASNEVGEGNCSVTTTDTCFEDEDCAFGEVCVNHVSVCQNSCR